MDSIPYFLRSEEVKKVFSSQLLLSVISYVTEVPTFCRNTVVVVTRRSSLEALFTNTNSTN